MPGQRGQRLVAATMQIMPRACIVYASIGPQNDKSQVDRIAGNLAFAASAE
jgi:hypothetical protein